MIIDIPYQDMLMKIIPFLLLTTVLGITMFNKRELTKQNGAMCMDGSPYAVYVYEPDPQDFKVIANKVLIFFESVPNGWCYQTSDSTSTEHCYKFISEDNYKDYGSSQEWGGSFFFLNGMLSMEGGVYFTNWPKVFLKNCDGGSYLGNADPVVYKKHKMYFRGSQNIKEAVKYLNKINFLKNRQEVVLAGSFNGGVGALLWSDYIKSQTDGKVKIIVDGSLYLNQLNHKHNTSVIEDRMRQVQKFNIESSEIPIKACAQANQYNLWRCLFTQTLASYIQTPIYFLQSYYDGFAIAEVLGYKCTQQFGSLSECTKEEKQIIDEYHQNVTKIMNKFMEKQSNSAFGIACVAHSFFGIRWDDEEFQVPMNSGHKPIDIVSNWASGKSRDMYMDTVQWPENKPCARKLVFKEKHLSIN